MSIVSTLAAGSIVCLRQDDGPMRCPVSNKERVRAGWLEKHATTCQGSPSSSAFRVGEVDLSKPSSYSHCIALHKGIEFFVSIMAGRRLPRLYRKISFAKRVEVQRAFSLPFRRLRKDSRNKGAWMLFLMLPCWCFTFPLRGNVASHRVTRQRIARYLGGD